MEKEGTKSNHLEVYGASWCIKSAKIRNYLQSKWIEFTDYDVETDKDAEQRVRAFYNGELKFPTVVKGNSFLKNPTIQQLDEFLTKD